MKHNAAVAKSYARALFGLARERNQADAVAKDLAAAAAAIATQPQLAAVLSRPWLGTAAKRAIATEVATRLGVAPLVRDFLALVALRNRADHLPAIVDAYRDLEDAALGRVRVKVRTAIALDDAERTRLRDRVSRALGGRQLVMDESVDATLLGGFVAEAGSLVLDASLDTQLARMRDRLARV